MHNVIPPQATCLKMPSAPEGSLEILDRTRRLEYEKHYVCANCLGFVTEREILHQKTFHPGKFRLRRRLTQEKRST